MNNKKLEEFSKYEITFNKHEPVFIDNVLRFRKHIQRERVYFAYETPKFYIFKKQIEDTTFIRVKKTNVTSIFLIQSAYDNRIFEFV